MTNRCVRSCTKTRPSDIVQLLTDLGLEESCHLPSYAGKSTVARAWHHCLVTAASHACSCTCSRHHAAMLIFGGTG